MLIQKSENKLSVKMRKDVINLARTVYGNEKILQQLIEQKKLLKRSRLKQNSTNKMRKIRFFYGIFSQNYFSFPLETLTTTITI